MACYIHDGANRSEKNDDVQREKTVTSDDVSEANFIGAAVREEE